FSSIINEIQRRREQPIYSVWAAPPDDVRDRLKKLMDGLRLIFGSPEFQTEQDALNKFKSPSEGVKAYTATMDRLAIGTFFYQCVYLLFHPTAKVVEANSHCSSGILGTRIPLVTYMPHLSLLYGDLTEEEKSAAQEKAVQLHDNINNLSFLIGRLELWKTDIGYTVLCT
ncbi:Cyclic phosphodiesterase, partial [Linum perenne]